MNDRQRTVVDAFTAACNADPRVIAAFLGGSYATGTADEHSDLDLYLVTSDASYGAFFGDRLAFLALLGRAVLAEDFNEFGFDMVVFILEDGVEGELSLGKAAAFLHIHGGPYRVLLDKVGVLNGAVFPLVSPSPAEQLETVRKHIHWFWRELSLFGVAIARERHWSAHAYLEAARRRCFDLLRINADFERWAAGYEKVESVVPRELLDPWSKTAPPFSLPQMSFAAEALIDLYRPLARDMCQRHGMAYPRGLDIVVSARLRRTSK